VSFRNCRLLIISSLFLSSLANTNCSCLIGIRVSGFEHLEPCLCVYDPIAGAPGQAGTPWISTQSKNIDTLYVIEHCGVRRWSALGLAGSLRGSPPFQAVRRRCPARTPDGTSLHAHPASTPGAVLPVYHKERQLYGGFGSNQVSKVGKIVVKLDAQNIHSDKSGIEHA
jgi:hypothetical protein